MLYFCVLQVSFRWECWPKSWNYYPHASTIRWGKMKFNDGNRQTNVNSPEWVRRRWTTTQDFFSPKIQRSIFCMMYTKSKRFHSKLFHLSPLAFTQIGKQRTKWSRETQKLLYFFVCHSAVASNHFPSLLLSEVKWARKKMNSFIHAIKWSHSCFHD